MSRSSALADNIMRSLNGATFSMEFEAVRKYRAYYTLKEMKTLHVTVVMSLIDQQQLSRFNNLDMITTMVVVQKHVDHEDNNETDAMTGLLEEIGEHFRSVDFNFAQWIGTIIDIPWDPDDLSEKRIFTGMISLKHQIAWVKD